MSSHDMNRPAMDELTSTGYRFCPLAAVAKFPYCYMPKRDRERAIVDEHFWKDGQFRARQWSIYYIETDAVGKAHEALILIPKHEVEGFFKEIYEKVGIQLAFPDASQCPGFDVGFHDMGEPRPQYLGPLTGANSISELQSMIPRDSAALDQPSALVKSVSSAFRSKLESAMMAGKGNKQAQRDGKRRERVDQKQRCCAQLKRAQRYLGVRGRAALRSEDLTDNTRLTLPGHQENNVIDYTEPAENLTDYDVSRAAQYPFDDDVVFVCIDIEVNERNARALTEVGISTLDTRDLLNEPPGDRGSNWMRRLRCRHFRVAEYAHVVNKAFVKGCPDKFQEDFGTSEWISVHELPQVVGQCFRPPYSEPGQYTPHPTSLSHVPRGGSRIRPLPHIENLPKRNIVLVGHEIRSDVQYLRSVGYDITNLSNVIEAVDTIDLWRAWKHEVNAPKLANILVALDIAGWNLHNAGNDAAYTLQCMIGICISALDSAKKSLALPKPEEVTDVTDKKEQRALEDMEEWAEADKPEGDGGEAVSMIRAEMDQLMSKAKKQQEKQAKLQGVRDRNCGPQRSAKVQGGQQHAIERSTRQQNTRPPKPTENVRPHLQGVAEAAPAESISQQRIAEPEGDTPQSAWEKSERLTILDDEW